MNKTAAALLLAFLALPVFSFGGPRPDVIYGDDDRIDLYQVQNQKLRDLADSTVALFDSSLVSIDPSRQTATLLTSHYGKDYKLCPEEPFYDQKKGAFCSGSLITPDIIMTAGHCITSQASCEGSKFVFGFAIRKKGELPEAVPASEVYGCAKLLGREQVDDGADWALVRLDRPVANHRPLDLNKSRDVMKDDLLFVIGHPAGLPTKVAGGAKVRDASPTGYFRANLDTYGGNSGSAVFNARTGLIEGILVRGEIDYVYKGNCRVSKVCTNDGCSGESVTKISAVIPNIPPPPASARLVSFGPGLPTMQAPDFDRQQR
jgi:hypothetical protein